MPDVDEVQIRTLVTHDLRIEEEADISVLVGADYGPEGLIPTQVHLLRELESLSCGHAGE